MKLLWVFLVGLALAFAGALYVRLAPTNPAVWHIDPSAAPDPDGAGVKVDISSDLSPSQVWSKLLPVIRKTPNTTVLIVSPDVMRITAVTRSTIWGFPDYATIEVEKHGAGSRVIILSRARFGSYDWGVNAERVEGWIVAAGLSSPSP